MRLKFDQLHFMIGNRFFIDFEGRGGLGGLVKNVECKLVSRVKVRKNNTDHLHTHPFQQPTLLKLCTPLQDDIHERFLEYKESIYSMCLCVCVDTHTHTVSYDSRLFSLCLTLYASACSPLRVESLGTKCCRCTRARDASSSDHR